MFKVHSAIRTSSGGSRSDCENPIFGKAGTQGSIVDEARITECSEDALSREALGWYHRLPRGKAPRTALQAPFLQRYSTIDNESEYNSNPPMRACTVPTPAAAAAPPSIPQALLLASSPALWVNPRSGLYTFSGIIGRISVRLRNSSTFRGWITGAHPSELTTDANAALVVKADRINAQVELTAMNDDIESRLGIRLAESPTTATRYCRLVRMDASGGYIPSNGLQPFRGENAANLWTIDNAMEVTVSWNEQALFSSLRFEDALYFTPGLPAASNPDEPRVRLFFEPLW